MKRKLVSLENLVNVIILVLIFLFLLSYFDSDVMLSKTITTGGDMASDYYPAKYLKDYLLPHGKIIGWCPGWYGGFPLFQFYFPLTFLLMVLMSYLIPLQISFKIITVLGTFLLPITTFFSMKLMKFKFPAPIVTATLTLPFLFIEANSMWGGNIPSTLAGEFSYSLSLSLIVLFFGLLYRGLEEKKLTISNSILFALVSITHVYTMLFAGLTSLFFFFERKKLKKNFIYLFKTYFLSFLLIAFWILPLVWYIGYTTTYADTWNVGIEKIFPKIIAIFSPLALVTVYDYIKTKDKRLGFLLFSLPVATILFFTAETMGVVNIRYAPFLELFLMIIAGYGLSRLVKDLKITWLFPFIVLLIVVVWVRDQTTFIPTWIQWNYEGFEAKALWNSFSSVNEFVSGSEADSRVVYEHSPEHNAAGTPRAFESLPLFSGRSTLEGLYMQSSSSAPFVFYIQSEISKVNSCPFWTCWPCTSFNIEDGTEHLKMFNVQYFIARSDQVKTALRDHSEYRRVEIFEPYEIYELMTNENSYVTVPKYEPVLFETKDWKKVSYEWFRDLNKVDIPLVFVDRISDEDRPKFKTMVSNEKLEDLTGIPIDSNCNIHETVKNEEVEFTTTCVGKPHIIRISYHPNWYVEGADIVYLVSPSFMLVFPTQEKVRLYYGNGIIDNAGIGLTIIGILFVIYSILSRNKKISKFLKR
jgi:hypothetical protein